MFETTISLCLGNGKTKLEKGNIGELPAYDKNREGTFDTESTATGEESEVDLDNSVVVAPDNDPPQQVGDASMKLTEEMQQNAEVASSKAMAAIAIGDFDAAVTYFTEAILSNPTSAILYADRAGVYVKMKKPNAAIRDADAAIKIAADSIKGYKWRGQAHAMLGHWEDAANDLHMASGPEYDEEIASILKTVESNALNIEKHRYKRSERLKRQHGENQNSSSIKPRSLMMAMRAGLPEGFILKILNNPELLGALQKLQDAYKDPTKSG